MVKKLIVNIPEEDLEIFKKASAIENRTRNNFIIFHSKNKALEILFQKALAGDLKLSDVEEFEKKEESH
jgi:uncharacterized protein (DUF1778 family)